MTESKTVTTSTQSLADRAYQEIRSMILDLRLLPGQTILIDELAEQLGMSRTPVREALARLGSGLEGLVETIPRKGIVVTIPSVEGMREIYEIIQGLESQAIKLALEHVDETALRSLEDIILTQEKALVVDDIDTWMQTDREFHHLLIDAAKNRRLSELVRMFDGQIHRTRVATTRLRPRANLTQSTQDHKNILEALRIHQLEWALKIHTSHCERALGDMVQIVTDYQATVVLRAAAQAAV
jgi:DNA-binding GntR family transcriptional regulator